MDFLDPRKRKAHKVRLMVGYVLMGIVILLTVRLLVYGVSGYSYNAKNGSIIQNGILFVDSKPGSATIYLNGEDVHSTSAAKLVLPAGGYDLVLKKSGYRDWQRKFSLTENSVSRYNYPLLIPVSPVVKNLKVYSSMPPVMLESPDKKWLLVLTPNSDLTVLSFDEYDTTKLDEPPVALSFPAGLLTNLDKPNPSFSVTEWSSDNDHFLLKHSFSGGSEFLLMSRSDPTKSFNINSLFNINPTEIALKNHKTDQLYIFNQIDQSLFVADIAKKSLQALMSHVLAFKSYSSDLFSYVTDQNVAPGQVMALIWDKNLSYPLYTFASGSKYLIDAVQFQGHWYYVAGSDRASRVNIFKDPLSGLKDPEINRAVPILSLGSSGNSNLSFSENFRFVAIQAGQKVSVYDIEKDAHYQFNLPTALNGLTHWLDGYRWTAQSQGSVLVMDYDSANSQTFSTTVWNQGAVIDKNSTYLFTLAPINGSSSIALQSIDLRTGVDVPKQ